MGDGPPQTLLLKCECATVIGQGLHTHDQKAVWAGVGQVQLSGSIAAAGLRQGALQPWANASLWAGNIGQHGRVQVLPDGLQAVWGWRFGLPASQVSLAPCRWVSGGPACTLLPACSGDALQMQVQPT